jgi:hypothetical protein
MMRASFSSGFTGFIKAGLGLRFPVVSVAAIAFSSF